MSKSLIVELAVPSGSRPSSLLHWLNKLLNPHRMSALTVSEVLPPKEQAQQLAQVLHDLDVEYRATVGNFPREEIAALANNFEVCEEIMRRLPR